MNDQEKYFLSTVRLEALKLAVQHADFEASEDVVNTAESFYKFLKEGVSDV